ncbi:MAG: glyoxalase [Solirubrobacteraceae bacterium]
MPILGLAHVQIAAPRGSERAARRFYGELLGLAELDKPELLREHGGVWFACGAQQLHVGVTDEFSPATKAHPVRRFYVDDPWGNRIELLAAGPTAEPIAGPTARPGT